jgi:hypothetical protein
MTSSRRGTVVARTIAAAVLGVLVTSSVVALAAAPAQAATYRYWTYWWGADSGKSGGGWTFAHVGPAAHRAGDTWVLGWRFGTSATTNGGAQPRQSARFADLCPKLATPVAGMDRVALVIDYGTTQDAPPGQHPPLIGSVRVECLTLPSHPSGVTVLNEAKVSVRQNDNGLLCALDGYPKNECAPIVTDPTPTPSPTRSSSHVPSPTRTPTPGATTSTLPRSGGSSPATVTTPASGPAASSASSPSSSSGSAALVTIPSSGSGPGGQSTLPAVSGSPVASVTDVGASSPVPAAVGVLLVALLGGSAWWTSRRRSP